jgi:archaemetzincin
VLPPPERGEWLAVHEEHGQTLDEYLASATPIDPQARHIDIRLVNQPDGAAAECLETLADFIRAFFQLPVRLQPPLTIDPAALVHRHDPASGSTQIHTGGILRALADARPADSFCVVGLTAYDLFPSPLVTFAFGEASATHRVAVCSFARYGRPYCLDPLPDLRRAFRARCCRVVAHEIGHMAGIQHCVNYRCLMNGSAGLDESERRPLRLCPVDLPKLEWFLGCDRDVRYRDLERFWRASGRDDEAEWFVHQRLARRPIWRRWADQWLGVS